VLAVGAWRVSSGDMSVSTLVAFLLYAFGLVGPVTDLSYHVTTLQTGLVAAARIREIEELDTEPSSAGERINFDPNQPAIAFKGVTAGYRTDGLPAVEDLTLSSPNRGHTAIVGPSGAGKTTVLSLILRFLDPSRGDLRLAGIPYSKLDFVQVREHFAYVEQETPTLPGTLRENLAFTNPAVTDPQIAAVLERLKLDTMVDRMPHGLDTPLTGSTVSGGQRQRIALARALLSNPDVLLLDEATAQLDALSEAAIHEVIREHASTRAVVTIAHRLSTIVDADTIVVMDAGRVVAQGRHEQLLLSSRLYRDLVDALRLEAKPTSELTAAIS
jgi:ABC-type multidrug transport system fused ATPase/permease subunit